MQRIAIVIPVYCEANNLKRLYGRLESVTGGLAAFAWEYLFVNDGSPDLSLEVLRELAQRDARVKVLDLSRNFGKEIALTAGVHAADTDAVICMDADLQHPPELIPKLVEEWQKGAEIVATIRSSIEKQPLLRRIGSSVYYWLMSRISGLGMVSQTTDFRLYDKKVVDAFRRVTERNRMFRGIMDWLGFRKVYVEFHADARNDGAAGYSYAKLSRLAIDSITAFSLWPLRLTGYLGVLITSTSGLLLTWMLGNYVFGDHVIFTPLAIVVVANTFLIGIVLMAVGLVAIYIGTIHTEVVNRPLYLVREKLNFDSAAVRNHENACS
jgi:glycosyltransferase involved in cell wall biosynthesis